MRLFTYILRSDSGFAPNPFWGWCTLACCKPAIRRVAAVGDLIVGITPERRGHRLVYAMEISEAIPFADYWNDSRFTPKRPRWQSSRIVERCGDNCYEPLRDGGFRQLPSMHSNADGTEDLESKRWDLSGERVSISKRFWYFGSNAVPLPDELSFAVVGRGHRSDFAEEQIRAFWRFLMTLPAGVQGPPARWKEGDTSYQQKPSASGKPPCQ